MKRKRSTCIECFLDRVYPGSLCGECNRLHFQEYDGHEMTFAVKHLRRGFPIDFIGILRLFRINSDRFSDSAKLLLPKVFIWGSARYEKTPPSLFNAARLVIRDNLRENLVNSVNNPQTFVPYSFDIPNIITDYINFRDFWNYFYSRLNWLGCNDF